METEQFQVPTHPSILSLFTQQVAASILGSENAEVERRKPQSIQRGGHHSIICSVVWSSSKGAIDGVKD